jgi:hypothetical protein
VPRRNRPGSPPAETESRRSGIADARNRRWCKPEGATSRLLTTSRPRAFLLAPTTCGGARLEPLRSGPPDALTRRRTGTLKET